MFRYFVSYKDSEGYEGSTLVGPSPTRMNNNEIADLLNEQLEVNCIDAKVIELTVKETNAVMGKIKHFLSNRK